MKTSQNITVGLLFFGALFMIGFFTISSEDGPFASSGKQIVAFFDNAAGIKIGSKVTIIGVPGGRVMAIDLISVDKDRRFVADNSAERVTQRVAITLELKKDLVFYENYSIDIKNASLLGGKVVSIDPGSAIQALELTKTKAKPPKKDIKEENQGESEDDVSSPINVFAIRIGTFSDTTLAQYLEARDDGKFVELQGNATGDPISGLSELISENRQNVKETIQNVRDITYKISSGQGTIGQLVNDDELHRNANTLVNDAQIVARELRETLEDQREQAPVDSFIRAMLTAF